jgi:hypothetical protein
MDRSGDARRREPCSDLTLAVASINSWNRLNIAFGTVAGAYRAGMYKNMIAGAEAH